MTCLDLDTLAENSGKFMVHRVTSAQNICSPKQMLPGFKHFTIDHSKVSALWSIVYGWHHYVKICKYTYNIYTQNIIFRPFHLPLSPGETRGGSHHLFFSALCLRSQPLMQKKGLHLGPSLDLLLPDKSVCCVIFQET